MMIFYLFLKYVNRLKVLVVHVDVRYIRGFFNLRRADVRRESVAEIGNSISVPACTRVYACVCVVCVNDCASVREGMHDEQVRKRARLNRMNGYVPSERVRGSISN